MYILDKKKKKKKHRFLALNIDEKKRRINVGTNFFLELNWSIYADYFYFSFSLPSVFELFLVLSNCLFWLLFAVPLVSSFFSVLLSLLIITKDQIHKIAKKEVVFEEYFFIVFSLTFCFLYLFSELCLLFYFSTKDISLVTVKIC